MVERGAAPRGTITVSEAIRRSRYSRVAMYGFIRSGAIASVRTDWQYFVNIKSFEKYCRKHGRAFTE